MNDNELKKLDEGLEILKNLKKELEIIDKKRWEFLRLTMLRICGWTFAFFVVIGQWLILHSYDQNVAEQLKWIVVCILAYCIYRAVKKVRIDE